MSTAILWVGSPLGLKTILYNKNSPSDTKKCMYLSSLLLSISMGEWELM
jgi:hypothetical protein